MRTLIYRLVEIVGQWLAEYSIRTTEGTISDDGYATHDVFDSRQDAEQWLRERAGSLNVPFLPATIEPTDVFLPLGGVIPTDVEN